MSHKKLPFRGPVSPLEAMVELGEDITSEDISLLQKIQEQDHVTEAKPNVGFYDDGSDPDDSGNSPPTAHAAVFLEDKPGYSNEKKKKEPPEYRYELAVR